MSKVKTASRLILTAFLSVIITQVLLLFGFPGETFPVKILVTLGSLAVGFTLISLAFRTKPKKVI